MLLNVANHDVWYVGTESRLLTSNNIQVWSKEKPKCWWDL